MSVVALCRTYNGFADACVGVNRPWIIKGCVRFDSNGSLGFWNNLNLITFVRVMLVGHPIFFKVDRIFHYSDCLLIGYRSMWIIN